MKRATGMTVVGIRYVLLASCILVEGWIAGFGQSAPAMTTDGGIPIGLVLSARSFPGEAPTLAPGGHLLAYTVQDRSKVTEEIGGHDYFTDTGAPKWLAGTDIWITDMTDGESINVTDGKGRNWDPVWSPNGRYLAFYSDRSEAARLWVYDTRSRSLRPVSDVRVRPFEESQTAQWTNDSKQLLVKVSPEDSSPVANTLHEQEHEPAAEVRVYRSGSITHQAGVKTVKEPDSFTQAERADLALVDLESAHVARIVSGLNPIWYEVSPDSRTVAFASQRGIEEGNRVKIHFGIVDRHSGREIVGVDVEQSQLIIQASWSPDGTGVAFLTHQPEGDSENLYLISIREHATTNITPHVTNGSWAFWAVTPRWSADSKNLFVLAHDKSISNTALWTISIPTGLSTKIGPIPAHRIDTIVAPQAGSTPLLLGPRQQLVVSALDMTTKRCGFYSVDLSERKFAKLLEEDKQYGPNQTISTFSSADGHTVIYMAQDVGHAPEYWSVSDQFAAPKRITHINAAFEQYPMGKSQLIKWRSLDGESLQGALLLPVDYRAGNKYPLIVWVYGGLNASDYLNYFGFWPYDSLDNMQVFSSRGYAVLFADSRVAAGSPMASLANSVLPGVNKAVELGIADPERLGIMGESFGGYSTLALIVQTRQFKAAIDRCGPANLIGLYGAMDKSGEASSIGILENGQFKLLGTPWDSRNRYLENSPVFYLDRVQTPLLVVEGSQDTAVPAFLTDEIFIGLQRLKKDVVYAKYQGEGHGIVNYSNRVDVLTREIEWFRRYLLGDESPMFSTQ